MPSLSKHGRSLVFYISRAVREIKKTGAKMIMHICGDTTDRLESMALTGVDCLSLDQKLDLGNARDLLGQRICLMGNVDPTHTLVFKKPGRSGRGIQASDTESGNERQFYPLLWLRGSRHNTP